MSSVDSSNTSRSILDRVVVPVLLACITAIGGVAAACYTSFSNSRAQTCARFNEKYDKLSDLPDSKSKLKRLNIIVEVSDYRDCPNYNEAARERHYLKNDLVDHNARTAQSGETPRSGSEPIGRSVAVTPAALPPLQAPAVDASQALRDFETLAPSSPAPIDFPDRLARANTAADEKALRPLVVSREPSKPLPDIVVRPLPPFSNPDLPFEGRVGEKLVMKKGDRFELRPAQYNTTTYNVAKGNVVVEVGGAPYFYCKTGDVFRLYWKNKPNFTAISSDPRSNLKITNVMFGKHLSTSTCMDAPG